MLKALFSIILSLICPLIAWSDTGLVEVRLSVTFASTVLDQVCSYNDIDEAEIEKSPIVQNMLKHFVKFRPDFTMENYISARRAAAECTALERDIFRFKDVIARKSQLTAELESLNSKAQSYSIQASKLVSQLSPKNIEYIGTAIPMIGTPSCGGWSSGETFYVDLPCMKGDQEGLIYLITHEIYHGIQDIFMLAIDENSSPIVQLFDSIIREGSALHVADFSKIKDPGTYSKLNQDVIESNRKRMDENFDLLEIVLTYLIHNSNNGAYKKAYSIGASGFFDSPYYAIGDVMTGALHEKYGSEATICLMKLPPQYFFYAYGDLVEGEGRAQELPVLSPFIRETLKAVGIDVKNLELCHTAGE